MNPSDIDPSYVPLIAADDGAEIYTTPRTRSRCRNIILYSTVTIALLMSVAGVVCFLLPGRQHSNSSATVTIVNRYSDDISVYQVSREGDEKILAHIGPHDLARVYPDKENQCFVRHLDEYIALERVDVHGSTVVIGGDGSKSLVPSRQGGEKQVVTFINDEDKPVILSWVDFEGVTTDMTQLMPYQQFDVETYIDHVFAISNADESREVIGQFTIRSDKPIIRTRPIIEPQDCAIRVTVENRTPGQVKLMWRDADGADHVVGVLDPDTKTVVDTFVGHEMYFLDKDGDETNSTIIVPSVTVLRAAPESKH